MEQQDKLPILGAVNERLKFEATRIDGCVLQKASLKTDLRRLG